MIVKNDQVLRVPILIPTLNRIEHLQRCISSLQQNSLAKETELYISVDYPPNEKYRDGYLQVVDFVKNISGFAKVHVYYQIENIGGARNSDFLRTEVRKEHDCFFYTEDDNVFSPNTLEFMNQALLYLKSREKIIAVSAAGDTSWKCVGKGNIYYRKRYSAWGYAMWFSQKDKIEEWMNTMPFDSVLNSAMQRIRLLFFNTAAYCCFAQDFFREIPAMRDGQDHLVFMDDVVNIYAATQNKVTLYPVERKVMNTGFDGSGIHCENRTSNHQPKIDQKARFLLDVHGSIPISVVSFWHEKIKYREPLKRVFRSIMIVHAKKWLSKRQFDQFQWKIQHIKNKSQTKSG